MLARQWEMISSGVASAPVAQHDDGVHRLAPDVAGDADHGDLRHRRVRRDRVLDLDRVDVLAAGHDHVLDPIDQVEIAVLVEVAGVAGVVPAAAERLLGRVLLVPVLDHVVAAARADLAVLSRRQQVAGLVLDRERDPGQRMADRAQQLAALAMILGA